MASTDEKPVSGPIAMLGTVVDGLLRAGAVAAEIMLALLVVMVTVEILMRNLFAISFGIVDELMGYFLVAIVFLGLGQSIREGALLRVDVFLNLLGPKVVRTVDRLYAAVGVVVLGIYLRQLWTLVANSYLRGTASGSAVAIPLWIPQSPMVVGALLGILGFVVLMVAPTRAREEDMHL
jgi:TRAP-type C4-dicarboxylate transport system permease small subunit